MTEITTTVSIDGQLYDAVTGLPVNRNPVEKTPSHAHAAPEIHHKTSSILHSQPQKSVTLNRMAAKRPVPLQKTITNHAPQVNHKAPVTIHHEVRKFAPHPVGAISQTKVMDIGRPVVHPNVAKAHQQSIVRQENRLTPAAVIKNDAIRKAVASTHTEKPKKQRKPLFAGLFRRQRLAGIASAVVAVLLFGGYLTYLNMPNLSVRLAAMQAGIDASYPSYHPDGYSMNGPVMATDGRVAMNFTSNAGPQKFTVSQTRSDWDNDAVLDNYVTPKAGSDYIPYTEHGLTIYAFGNNAAWVNGGILYTIEGDAPLSSEQIRHMATSLL